RPGREYDVLIGGPEPVEMPASLCAAGVGHVAARDEALLDALPLELLAAGAAWVDLNYWDRDPPGLARAASEGLRTVTGDGMLAAQAALSFEAWTGRRPVG
ncbi:MAG: hypothetical protein KC621_35245, partial [Myxococcales bacterium]|nr:hypothetical protein [Myxococcales bacterium]